MIVRASAQAKTGGRYFHERGVLGFSNKSSIRAFQESDGLESPNLRIRGRIYIRDCRKLHDTIRHLPLS